MSGVTCMAVVKALGEMTRLRMMRLPLTEQLGVNAVAHRLGLERQTSDGRTRQIAREMFFLMAPNRSR